MLCVFFELPFLTEDTTRSVFLSSSWLDHVSVHFSVLVIFFCVILSRCFFAPVKKPVEKILKFIRHQYPDSFKLMWAFKWGNSCKTSTLWRCCFVHQHAVKSKVSRGESRPKTNGSSVGQTDKLHLAKSEHCHRTHLKGLNTLWEDFLFRDSLSVLFIFADLRYLYIFAM